MKKLLTIVLAIALVVSAMSISAFADDSTAAIKFTGGSITVDPDPDPDPGYTSIGPKNIEFIDTQITGLAQNINTTKSGDPLGLRITDATGLATSRWTITASITDFEATGGEKLEGSVLTLNAVTADIIGPGGAGLPAANLPTQNTITLSSADAAKNIFVSNSTNGSLGKWASNWTPELDILAGTAEAVSYEATITWTVV